MKKVLVATLSILCAVIMSLVFPFVNENVHAAQEDLSYESYYLVKDDAPYRSNVVVGHASGGYGDLELNKSATIYANAVEGYKLVGWYIIYVDREKTEGIPQSKFITERGNTADTLGGQTVTYKLDFDVNNPANNQTYDGSINIDRVGENLNVIPVFDFEYFKLEITNFFDLIDGLTQYDESGLPKPIYYTEKVDNNLQNAIIKQGDEYFYIGSARVEDGKVYSIHNSIEDTPQEQLVEVGSGEWRANEKVEILLNLKSKDFDKIFTEKSTNKNIELTRATFDSDSASVDLTESMKKTQSTEGITKSFGLEFDFAVLNNGTNTIFADADKKISLNLSYNQIYLVEIVPYLDGVKLTESDADNTARKLILEQLSITPAYYTFTGNPNARYLVKAAAGNNGLGAELVYPNTVYYLDEASGLRYYYYQFSGVDSTDLSDIFEDKQIEIKFESIKYYVQFKFALKTENGATVLNDMKVEPSIALNRGQSPSEDISKTEASDNLGYKFLGFTDSLDNLPSGQDGGSTLDKNSIKIDETKPTDVVIYMVYEYEKYSVKLTGLNSISLKNGEVTIYPYKNIKLSTQTGQWPKNLTKDADISQTNGEITFNAEITIVNFINFEFDLNNGFSAKHFTVSGTEITIDASSGTAMFDMSQILNAKSSWENNQIVIQVSADYLTYSLNYSLYATRDANKGSDVLMGSISMVLTKEITGQDGDTTVTLGGDEELDEQPKQYGRLTVTATKTDNLLKFSVDGLRLYDVVKLKTTAKERGEGNYYKFNRFLESNINTLKAEKESDNNYYADYSIFRNADVVVSFVVPTTMLEVVSNYNAIDFENISVTINSNTQLKFDSTGQISKIDTGSAKVSFNMYSASNGIKFGYVFDTATLTADEETVTEQLDINKEGTPIEISFKLGADSKKYTLHLEFKLVEYKLSLNQTNEENDKHEGWENTKVKFLGGDEENEYTILTVSNLVLSFNVPTGYFANRFYSDDWQLKLTRQEEEEFSYEFDLDELETLVNKLSSDTNADTVTLDLNVEYSVKRYSLTIQFVVNSDRPQNDEQVLSDLPELQFDGDEIQPTRRDNSLVYEDIKYNTKISVSVLGGIRVGLVGVGWFDQFGINLPSESVVDGKLNFTLTNNTIYQYKLQYEQFAIKLTKQENVGLELNLAGDPESLVNGEINKSFKLFDNLQINANAHRTNGYTFDYISYNKFVPYTYNSNWEDDSKNLYYLSDGKYIKLTDYVYNPETKYFSVQPVETNAGSLNLNNFDVSDLEIKGEDGARYIEFVVAYKELDILLSSSYSVNSNELKEYETTYGFIDTPVYRFERYNKNTAQWDEDTNPVQSALHYRDIVHIYINFNSIDGTPFGLEQQVNLKVGIRLQVFVGGRYVAFSDNDEFDNYLWFNISSVLNNLPEDTDTITINYQFTIEDKTLIYTTNVTDPEFYVGDGQQNFVLTIRKENADVQELPFVDDTSAQNFGTSNKFLSAAILSFESKLDVYTENLFVSGVRVYMQNDDGQWTDEILDFSSVGVRVNYSPSGRVESINYNFLTDIKLELVIQPIISGFNSTSLVGKTLYQYQSDGQEGNQITREHEFVGGYLFNLNPVENNKIVGNRQPGLSVGINSNYNIQVNEFIAQYVKLEYYLNDNLQTDGVVNVGSYRAMLTFKEDAPTWLKEIGFDQYNIVMTINPAEVDLVYTGEEYAKTYAGQNRDGIDKNILDNIIIPNITFRVKDCLLDITFDENNYPTSAVRRDLDIAMRTDGKNNPNFKFSEQEGQQPTGHITTTINGQEVGVYNASLGNEKYNITIDNLFLVELYNPDRVGNTAIKNFKLNLNGNSKTFTGCATILRKTVYLDNLHFRDKIYDGNDNAIIDNRYSYTVSGLGEDAAYLDILMPQAVFVTDQNQVGKDIGKNKRISIVNLDSILVGRLARNYNLMLRPGNEYTASIYPDQISTKVDGYGTITLVNLLGRDDPSKVNLIPFDATLSVDVVRAETGAYNRIYRYIAEYLKSKSYGVGYRLRLSVNGAESEISNQLYLQLPTISRLSGVVHLSNANVANAIGYDIEGSILIDLRQVDGPNMFIVIKNRPLLTWWQILIIVLLVLLIVAVIVIIVIVRRKKKLDKYKQQEKI